MDMSKSLKNHFVHIEGLSYLKKKQADKCIEILTGQAPLK
jgi:hypothetical protein